MSTPPAAEPHGSRRLPLSRAGALNLHTFHAWALSLPWVTERPYRHETPGVRAFAVDCEPLNRRQLWLVTGLPPWSGLGDEGIAVILPLDAAEAVEAAGWGRRTAVMPARHVLVSACAGAVERRHEIEALAFSAYTYAMAAD